jgi:hypothetical protein
MQFHRHLNLTPFNDAPESGGATGLQDILDLMGEDDNPDDKSEKVVTETEAGNLLAEDDKKEEEKEEKEPEIKLEPEEEEEPSDEVKDELELISPASRKEILAKYPTLFKDFPYLEKAYYREQKYTSIFPSPKEAEEAKETVDEFQKFQNSVLNGDLDDVLVSLKDTDKSAFDKVVNNYLGILKKTDEGAWAWVCRSVIDAATRSMAAEANGSQNDDDKKALIHAATVLHQFMFGNRNYQPLQKYGNGEERTESPEVQKLQQEKQEMLRERFEGTRDDLNKRADGVISNTISVNIDPKGVMTEYVKNSAVRETKEKLDSLIASDDRFTKVLDNLWMKAAKENFSRSSQQAIYDAYISKVKTLLPSVLRTSRNNALRGSGKRVSDKMEEPQKKGPISAGRPTAGTSGGSKLEIRKGETTKDFFMRD